MNVHSYLGARVNLSPCTACKTRLTSVDFEGMNTAFNLLSPNCPDFTSVAKIDRYWVLNYVKLTLYIHVYHGSKVKGPMNDLWAFLMIFIYSLENQVTVYHYI